MKKIITIVLLALLIVISFAACSADKKSEEALKAEIKAELEEEEKKKEALKEALKAELKAEMEEEQKKKETAKEEPKQETVVGPVNIAIKNYNGDGLERLSKVKVDVKQKFGFTGKEVIETLTIFGEVTNVEIGCIQMYTEGNYALAEKFDSLKDTELTIRRSSSDDKLITVTFYDKGLRSHTFAFTDEKDHYMSDKTPDKQELAANLDEKYKAPTAYKDRSDLVLKSIGLSEKAFESSNIFDDFTEKVDDFDGSEFYEVENDPFGYRFILMKGYDDASIFQAYITSNEGYNAIKDDAKCSFFGVDFDMPIYQARYNLKVPQDNISVDLVEHFEEAGKLGGIRVSIVRK